MASPSPCPDLLQADLPFHPPTPLKTPVASLPAAHLCKPTPNPIQFPPLYCYSPITPRSSNVLRRQRSLSPSPMRTSFTSTATGHDVDSPRESSPLTSLGSRSPSPAPSTFDLTLPSVRSTPRRLLKLKPVNYPTPPSSQNSGPPSPRESEDSAGSDSNESDGLRPAKRRRLNSMGPRETKRISLRQIAKQPDSEQNVELDRLIKGLRTKRKIVVVAGAGISVSAGIPDFRSSSGLFKSLKAEHKLKGSGKSLFDADVYRDDTSTTSFHAMVRELSKTTKEALPTPFHHLLARLAHEGRLLRLYTQNVDGIDTSLEPLRTQVPLPRKGPWPKTIQVHGGLEKMVCTKCGALADFDADIFNGPVPPECSQCVEVDKLRTQVAGKRSHGVGKLRPRMVLYNEPNPDDEAIGSVAKADMRRRPDAIIVVGTSMKIPGVRRIVREMCKIVRDHRDGLSVWINNDPEPSGVEFKDAWDIVVEGKCDDIAAKADLGRWDEPDPIGESVTDEQMQLAKDKSQPVVLVHTSSRDDTDAHTHLPTPETDTITLGPSEAKTVFVSEHPEKSKSSKAKTKNGATRGKPLSQILGSKTIGTKGKPGPKKAKASQASKAHPPQQKINTVFKQSKTGPRAANTKLTGVGKENLPPKQTANKSAPATPSKKSSNAKISTPIRSPVKFPNLRPVVEGSV